jgi:hypothetical protein
MQISLENVQVKNGKCDKNVRFLSEFISFGNGTAGGIHFVHTSFYSREIFANFFPSQCSRRETKVGKRKGKGKRRRRWRRRRRRRRRWRPMYESFPYVICRNNYS